MPGQSLITLLSLTTPEGVLKKGAAIVSGWINYALKGTIKNPRRTLTAIAGVVLAITLIAGENISIDSASQSILKAMLDKVTVDFQGAMSYGEDYQNATTSLESVENVERVEPLAIFYSVQISVSKTNVSEYCNLIALRHSFSQIAYKFTLEGNTTAPPGEILLDKELGNRLGVQLGENVSIFPGWHTGDNETESHYHNFTVGGFFYVQGEKNDRNRYFFDVPNVALMDMRDIKEVSEDLATRPSFLVYIWIDRGKVIDPYDIDASKRNLERIRRHLELAGSPYGVDLFEETPLMGVLDGLVWIILAQRVLFLAFSIPVVGLALYLGYIGADLSMGERRRELGILKSRGASNKQIFLLLAVESILLGIIAGILGLTFGIGVSRLFLYISPFKTIEVSPLSIAISPITVTISIIFGICFMIIIGYQPAKRVSGVAPTEALRRFSPKEAEMRYKPTWDAIFLSLAALEYGLLLYLRGPGGSGVFFVLLCMLSVLMLILLPFAPFFLIFGLTRLLTRATSKVYGAASVATKLLAKRLWYVVNKNLMRNPRRASNICIVLALGLAFGIFVSSMSESAVAYAERSIEAEVGSDIKVEASDGNLSLGQEITKFSGVDEVCPSLESNVEVGRGGSIILLNSTLYPEVVNVNSYYFLKGESSSIRKLQTSRNVIVNEYFSRENYVGQGDDIMMSIPWNGKNVVVPLHIVAVAKVLPGLMTSIQSGQGSIIYSDFRSFNESQLSYIASSATKTRFLIDVAGEQDPSAVAQEIRTSLVVSGSFQVIVLQEELNRLRNDPVYGALFSLMTVEVAFAVLILTVGLGLVMYIATLEREDEFATIRARGCSRSQVSSIIMAEGISLMLIGLSIGVGTGLLTAYVFNELLSYSSEATTPVLERPLIIGTQTVSIIAISVISLLAASFLASFNVRQRNLTEILRRRGG